MKKRRILFIGLTGIILIILMGIYLVWQNPKVRHETFTFAYGEEIPYDSSSYLQYGFGHEDITFDKDAFSMNELGDYQVEVTYEGKSYSLHIQIVDKEAPVITFSNDKEVTLYRKGENLLMDELFTIDDMSETTYEVTPKESELKTGTQTICVNATDAYGNDQEQCKEVTIKIEDYENLISANVTQGSSVEEIITRVMKANNLNKSNFAFFYYSPEDEEEYIYNPDTMFNAASTIKVPLNMIYEDLKNKGELKNTTTYKLQASDIEEGDGDTSTDYKINQTIPLSYLQEQSIRNSDNTATNMLIRELGGFTAFRNMLPEFSDENLPSSFYKNNETNAAYMLDVMKYLYEHRSDYATLIEYMKHASEGSFLQESTDMFTIAQKYGDYDTYLHSIGIVYTPEPYIVGIYTNDCVNAYNIILEINESLIAYQLNQKG